jgi:hypothetical protein
VIHNEFESLRVKTPLKDEADWRVRPKTLLLALRGDTRIVPPLQSSGQGGGWPAPMLEATIVSKRTVGLRANVGSAGREILDPELLNLFSLLGRRNARHLRVDIYLMEVGQLHLFFRSCYQVLIKVSEASSRNRQHRKCLAKPVYRFCTNGLRFLRTRWFLRLRFQ